MKKIAAFFSGIAVLAVSSCTKAPLNEHASQTTPGQFVAQHQKNQIVPSGNGLNEPSLVQVTVGGSGTYSGQFISSYSAGGVTFGATLPHPIDDPAGIYDGYPILGGIGYVNYMVSSSPCNTIINGAYFTIFEPTLPTTGLTVAESTVNSIAAYDNALNAIFQEPYSATVTQATKNAQVANVPSPSINVTVDGPGTYIVVRGLLIRDHTSPTMMSIVTDKFVTPPVTSPAEMIGQQIVNGYTCSMYAPFNSPSSGPIASVSVKYSGNPVSVMGFSLSYTGDDNFGYHTVGTITITGGTVLNIDSWLYP